jgi:stage III sporulation protein SpoIIIAA
MPSVIVIEALGRYKTLLFHIQEVKNEHLIVDEFGTMIDLAVDRALMYGCAVLHTLK